MGPKPVKRYKNATLPWAQSQHREDSEVHDTCWKGTMGVRTLSRSQHTPGPGESVVVQSMQSTTLRSGPRPPAPPLTQLFRECSPAYLCCSLLTLASLPHTPLRKPKGSQQTQLRSSRQHREASGLGSQVTEQNMTLELWRAAETTYGVCSRKKLQRLPDWPK